LVAGAWDASCGGRAGAEAEASTSKTTAAKSKNDLSIIVSSVADVGDWQHAAVQFLFDSIIGAFESELHHVVLPSQLPLFRVPQTAAAHLPLVVWYTFPHVPPKPDPGAQFFRRNPIGLRPKPGAYSANGLE
jgi:hypothetical protein